MFLPARVCAAAVVIVALALVGAGLARPDDKRVGDRRSHCQPISSRLLRGHSFYLGSARTCTVAIKAARPRFASRATLVRSSTASETGQESSEPGAGGHTPTLP